MATRSATAEAASGSRARAIRRFQNVWVKADESARTRADVGTRIVFRAGATACCDLRLQRNAIAGRADPLRDLPGAVRRARPPPQLPEVLRRSRGTLQHRDRADLAG